MLTKLKELIQERAKKELQRYKEKKAEEEAIKTAERKAYVEERISNAHELAKKKIKEEQKQEVNKIKEKPQSKSNWDVWGGIEKFNKQMVTEEKNKEPIDINKRLREML